MDILLIGGTGMLGSDLRTSFEGEGWSVVAPSRKDFDLASAEDSAKLALGHLGRFDLVVNAAAYTNVDLAESEQDACYLANVTGPSYLAKAAASHGAGFVQFSTDFVFDGNTDRAYNEFDSPNPIGVYAKSKHEGELAVQASHPAALIVRTAWLFGPSGKSFPKTILAAYKSGKPLRVVGDQVGSPTYTAALATVVCRLISMKAEGIVHAVGPDVLSWFQLAELTLSKYLEKRANLPDPVLTKIQTVDWPTPAVRPKYSVLSSQRLGQLGIKPMPPINLSIEDFLNRLDEY